MNVELKGNDVFILNETDYRNVDLHGEFSSDSIVKFIFFGNYQKVKEVFLQKLQRENYSLKHEHLSHLVVN